MLAENVCVCVRPHVTTGNILICLFTITYGGKVQDRKADLQNNTNNVFENYREYSL